MKSQPLVLTFVPEEIEHPNSTDWTPPDEVVEYMDARLRKPLKKEVRSRLRSECPRPLLKGKASETPEIDPTIVTYMGKYSRDPRKGLDRSLKACQDKLLDMSGPLAKILEMGYEAKASGAPLDPDILVGWAQRSICLLGNPNCALSAERRKSIFTTDRS